MLLRTFNVPSNSVISNRCVLIVLFLTVDALIASADTSLSSNTGSVFLTGYRFDASAAVYDQEELAYRIPGGKRCKLKIFGERFSNADRILFTKQKFSINETCDSMDHTASFELNEVKDSMASAEIVIETGTTLDVQYFMCVRDKNGKYHHLGDESRLLVVFIPEHIMPLPIQVILVTLCLLLSSIFSGLNLGLMSLDVGELKLIMKCGSPDDRVYAKAILPIRRRGNTLLCTLLFGNTIVNASCTLLMDDLIGQGVLALVGSTIGILIFGEIVPQSICSRYGLRVGYYCRFIVLFFMFALFPVTFSIGKLLDLLLGREIHQVYSREELREMVKMSFALDDSRSSSPTGFAGRSGLKREEVNIVTGALEITEATVSRILKKKDEIFMLDISVAIDYDLIELITRHGYTRIPIYANGDRNNIVGLLSTKDLLGIDPEDKLPLNSLVEYYPRSILRVLENTTILDMLNLFKTAKVHLAIVDRIVCDEEHDPTKEMVGIVTLEDVIEFILREEINDEADDLKERRRHEELAETKSHHNQPPFKRADTIPQQLNTAAVQFLIANVEAFRKEIVERKVLANLLRFPGIFVVKKHAGKNVHFNDNALYAADKEADYFILVLQGSCQVYIGRERLPFEAGPFHYFGLEALIGVGNVKYINPLPLPGPHFVSPSADSISPNNSTSGDATDDVIAQQQLLSAIAEHNADYHDTTGTLTLGRRMSRSTSKAKRVISFISQIAAPLRGADHHPAPSHHLPSIDHPPATGTSHLQSSSHHNMPGGKSSMASILTEESSEQHPLGHGLSHKQYSKGPQAASSNALHKTGLSHSGSQTSLSSVHPAYQYSRKCFVPDFTVEITQDAQYVRLTNAHYRALLTVTQLVRRKEKLDDTAFIVDKLWSELIREGEQFPNFELVGPRLVSVIDAGIGPGSSRATPPQMGLPMAPLRVSIPNLHNETSGRLKADGSQAEFLVGSSQPITPVSSGSKAAGVDVMTESTISLITTPGRPHRQTSPLRNALLANSRGLSIDSGKSRHRSATSGEVEPLLTVSASPAGLHQDYLDLEDSAVVFPPGDQDKEHPLHEASSTEDSSAKGPVA